MNKERGRSRSPRRKEPEDRPRNDRSLSPKKRGAVAIPEEFIRSIKEIHFKTVESMERFSRDAMKSLPIVEAPKDNTQKIPLEKLMHHKVITDCKAKVVIDCECHAKLRNCFLGSRISRICPDSIYHPYELFLMVDGHKQEAESSFPDYVAYIYSKHILTLPSYQRYLQRRHKERADKLLVAVEGDVFIKTLGESEAEMPFNIYAYSKAPYLCTKEYDIYTMVHNPNKLEKYTEIKSFPVKFCKQDPVRYEAESLTKYIADNNAPFTLVQRVPPVLIRSNYD